MKNLSNLSSNASLIINKVQNTVNYNSTEILWNLQIFNDVLNEAWYTIGMIKSKTQR